MLIKGARILVVSGVAFFGLRGVLGTMAPLELAGFLLLLVGGAAVFDHYLLAQKKCLIGELACRQGLLSERHVAHILTLQRESRERFGEIALRERYLSSQQLGELLELQAM